MNRVRTLLVLTPIVALSGPVFAQNPIQNQIPDFYQHQGLGSATPVAGWEGVGTAGAAWDGTNKTKFYGICAETAITDALYPWYATGNYPTLFGSDVTVKGSPAARYSMPTRMRSR